jgi:prophage regulatory protein
LNFLSAFLLRDKFNMPQSAFQRCMPIDLSTCPAWNCFMTSADEKLDAILRILKSSPGPVFDFWRMPKVVEKTGMCKASINNMVRAGKFPAPRQIGAHAVAWRSDEVLEWMHVRPVVSEVIE